MSKITGELKEAWEILFCKISGKDIETFKNIAPRVILSIDPIFEFGLFFRGSQMQKVLLNEEAGIKFVERI